MRDTISSFSGRYRWLSNFWSCKVKYHSRVFPSVEHGYQAAKYTGRDEHMVEVIRLADTAADAKALGKCPGMRADWEMAKLGVMEDLIRIKFAPKSDLARKLLATGDAPLIEGNDFGDRWWGVCDGVGDNHLGKILMAIREELRHGAGT